MSRGASRATGRPTLVELARIAGVSPITASRAMRGVPSVDPELARRVHEAAAEIDYVANTAARTLASSYSDSVVVLIPSLSNLLFIDTLEAIHAVMHGRGLEVLIGNFHYAGEAEHSLLRNYLAYQPRGLILTGLSQMPATRRLIARSRIPAVHMMDLAPGTEQHCVGFSQADAGAAAARHLAERGRSRLAYVAAQLDPRTIERGEGFQRAAQADLGLAAPVVLTDEQPSSVALGGHFLARLVEEHPEVDGVFFNNDDLAQGALFEAQRRGIAIPSRMSMIGFNDLPLSAHMVPRLTSIRTPRARIGETAARHLLRLIDGESVSSCRLDLGFELMVRESS
ncbi:LacI family DNA-binding transcriptional regulator [Ancylobacter sp. 6x-1]|uniref:LacI family DNA-binding transcriptional regulator n=1 Tax=Ancylobacter crimeensis TaxID=2579147 RepID=A0ABT0D8Z7_9HYPH|nr:LacI family DNA-binding transcriptional regulator [Ancylobacter crimeensis]MCK0196424.1 LacI family DNA-binding transcriptional regulator [Ancylobacter crimeensis]